MNAIVENLTGMTAMTDQVIAYDFLIAAKTGIRNYAVAITETATPEVRQILRGQLDQLITTHESISNYAMSKGWYFPYNVKDQINLDMQNAQTAQSLGLS